MQGNVTAVRVDCENKDRWDKFLTTAYNITYRQSFSFVRTHTSKANRITTFIFERDGHDIAGAHYNLKSTVQGFLKVADIQSGIVFRELPSSEILEIVLKHFTQWARNKKASYLRVNPWVPSIIDGETPNYCIPIKEHLLAFGLEPLTKGANTYWIDLTQSEEELLKRMKSTTRSKIRKVLQTGFEVEVVDSPNQELVNQFWEYYIYLGNRKGFSTLSEKRFKAEVNALLKQGEGLLFWIKCKGSTVYFTLVSTIGNAMYFHGAKNPKTNEILGCPSPGYFVQWAIIRHMKELGFSTYDMAFCPGATPIKEHPNFDMWRFKHGFGGMHVQYMPTYGKPLNPIRGILFGLWRYKKLRINASYHTHEKIK
jgi:lipid II:glycine glycyltransferase (peptidoglycan interpeptide bridge formation enzyme)